MGFGAEGQYKSEERIRALNEIDAWSHSQGYHYYRFSHYYSNVLLMADG
jgi:hypothetical protein